MIIAIHNNHKVLFCKKDEHIFNEYNGLKLYHFFSKISSANPNEFLIWVHEDLEKKLNYKELGKIFHHKRIMASYSQKQYLSDAIGYVEQGPFININYDVKYPTWRMHKNIGGIHTSVINSFIPYLNTIKNIDEFLHSIAKIGQTQGLLCYSEPNLLIKNNSSIPQNQSKSSKNQLFYFVAQHYKPIWKHLLLLNFILYERSFPLFSWFKSCFIKKIKIPDNLIEEVVLFKVNEQNIFKFELDVIIPTIGRKKYLYNVLKDLSNQTIIPKNVIVIEQNPDAKSESELDYLYKESWPFLIKHKFIHQTGACNARNIGLDLVESKWVFLADDDIRMNTDFLLKSLSLMKQYKIDALVTECLMEKEKSQNKDMISWHSFGSGTSILLSKNLNHIKFDLALEHGYGEDVDFGLSLRNKGIDILYTSIAKLKHLKAPVGGFRYKKKLIWKNDKPVPKPSPTVLLSKLKHNTKEQILGYKTNLFFKTLKKRGALYSFQHFIYFRKAWVHSVYWANILRDNNIK